MDHSRPSPTGDIDSPTTDMRQSDFLRLQASIESESDEEAHFIQAGPEDDSAWGIDISDYVKAKQEALGRHGSPTTPITSHSGLPPPAVTDEGPTGVDSSRTAFVPPMDVGEYIRAHTVANKRDSSVSGANSVPPMDVGDYIRAHRAANKQKWAQKYVLGYPPEGSAQHQGQTFRAASEQDKRAEGRLSIVVANDRVLFFQNPGKSEPEGGHEIGRCQIMMTSHTAKKIVLWCPRSVKDREQPSTDPKAYTVMEITEAVNPAETSTIVLHVPEDLLTDASVISAESSGTARATFSPPTLSKRQRLSSWLRPSSRHQ